MADSAPEDPVAIFMSLDHWDDADDPSQPESQPVSETYLVGFVIANIVGIQYYSGRISGREMVGLVREPLNRFDENAIKVLNTRMVQVGHIDRSVAAVLSPLIDDGLISVEGIVPNTRSSGNRYRVPCQVHVFARAEAFPRVQSAISGGGLQLISESNVSFTLSEAMVVKEKKGGKETRSVDEIFKLVDENVNKKAKMEALEPPKSVIKSELFLHQKEGLGWLLQRETSTDLPPFWEEKDGSYVNVLTNYHTDNRPEPLRGGIFADDMGLGKTLTLLSLIAFDKFATSTSTSTSTSVYPEGNAKFFLVDDSIGKKGKRGRSKKGIESRKRQKTGDVDNLKGKSVAPLVAKTTLIVCPPSVFSSWVTQLAEHTIRGKLKVYMYYGDRTSDPEELCKYDIVLTTYSTLAVEEPLPASPVKKIEWWRVILDEAHVIKNVNARQSRAVTNLNAKRRWVVTGTPIQNGSVDLFSLMAFLRFEPFAIKSYWQGLVQRPIAQGKHEGISRLQVLMATISLRRTKDKGLIGLPSKTIEICHVDLSWEERELYDKLEAEAKGVVQRYINDENVTRNYSTILSIILRLRQICDDMTLCPSDLSSLIPSNNVEDVSNNPELLRKMVAILQDGEDFDCPICICPPVNVLITRCAHIFCRVCILKTLQHTKPCCPLCRRPLSQSDLFSAPPESSGTDNSEISSKKTTSSKVAALLKLLVATRSENSSRKSVVFSQFRKMLLLLEEPLKAAGFKTLRLDGSMNAKKRAQVIEEFGKEGADTTTVLLASIKASGAGINLAVASRVYLLEPWWNPAVEEQAMDRVHRIGQKEDVKIVRLIARNCIEERVLELQERKKKLAREAFCQRQGVKDRREVNINDLRVLMSL